LRAQVRSLEAAWLHIGREDQFPKLLRNFDRDPRHALDAQVLGAASGSVQQQMLAPMAEVGALAWNPALAELPATKREKL
jgi:hypothetical protein